MSVKQMLAWGSLPVLVIAASLGVSVSNSLAVRRRDNRIARMHDRFVAKVATAPCARIKTSSGQIDRARKVNEAFNFTVLLENTAGVECVTSVRIDAASFKVAPTPSEQTVTVPPGGVGVTWNLMAEHAGPQQVLVKAAASEATFGFEVREGELIPPKIALVASIVLAFLGPTITLPYWLERRAKRREKEVSERKPPPPPTLLDQHGHPIAGA